MALSENDNSDCNSDSSVDGTKQERKEKLFTKVVVRRLPPSMNKESFLNQISPLPDFDYLYFVRADMSLGEYSFSRAYINFKNPTDIFIFKEKFDNYVFLDSRGNEYVAVVEFAPFCRIPKKRNKARTDPKNGMIETDPVYLEFVESLNEVSTEAEEKPEYCFQPSLDEDKKVINTPLLEYIKQRKLDRLKLKEEKREERKRRELERKRCKDDDRKGRKRIEHVSHSISKVSSSKNTNSSLDAIEENKSESSMKLKERKDDYRNKPGKPGIRDFSEKRSYISGKDGHKSLERKSPTKIRQRSQNYSIEREQRRAEFKNKREELSNRNKKDDNKEDKITEKKVKKYSERREERKNEFKKPENKSESTTNVPSEDIAKNKSESKSDESRSASKESNTSEPSRHTHHHERKSKYDSEKLECYKENMRHRDDPRTQRRIRNKDRPTMAIYQPGRGLNRNKKPGSDGNEDEQKSSNTSESKSQ